MKNRVVFGAFAFKFKKDAVAWLRGLKNEPAGTAWRPGSSVFRALELALQCNPGRGDHPLGSPQEFFVDKDPFYRQQRLAARWVCGHAWPFSYKKCVSAPSPRTLAMQTFRYEIEEQISRVAVPGRIVHHTGRTFMDLVEGFVSEYELNDLGTVEREPVPGRDHLRLQNRALAHRWQVYHKVHAVLAVLTPAEHAEEHYGP